MSDDPDRAGNPVLFSGNENNTDASAVVPVTVPAADPTLTFLAKYGAEEGYDYGYVQVSTDGGKTYTPIAGDKTVDGPLGAALNGTTTGSSRTRSTCRRTPGRTSWSASGTSATAASTRAVC